LDEPTAFLDLPRRVEVMVLLRDLAHRTGRTILLSTHDLDLALRCADQMWLIDYGGRLSVGVPEDLVLNGTFEAAFHSANVTFDIETGAFKAYQSGTRHMVLEGDGVQSIWTRRALEREGFSVVTEREPGLPIIRLDGTGEQTWSLMIGGRTIVCHSIDALLMALHTALVAV
jgi:iron complex transport system ATP-binding protein